MTDQFRPNSPRSHGQPGRGGATGPRAASQRVGTPTAPAKPEPAAVNLRDPEQLLENLDPEQRQVARQLMGPLVVRAGAGTGKTRAITYRIAYGVHTGAYDPSSVLAITYTRRAAGEMAQRLDQLQVRGVQARTFHSAALRQLQFFWPRTIGGKVPPIKAHKASIVNAAAARLGLLGTDTRNRELVRDLASEVEWAKVSLVDAQNYPQLAAASDRPVVGDFTYDQVADVIGAYDEVKDEAGFIDFEDVLILMAALLREREDVARAVRNQYRHFVVDEFQDVSPLQFELLSQWLGERHEICVVGDVAQTIYSFAGADWKYLANFPRYHPGAREVELNRDYRSTPQIVSVANHSLMTSPRPGMAPQLPAGAVHLVSQRDSGPAVSFTSYSDDAQEAEGVVGEIKKLLKTGVRPGQIAVLVRTNAQTEPYETALNAAGISVALKDQTPFFDRPAVKECLTVLRQATQLASLSDTGASGGDTSGEPEQVIELVQGIIGGLGWTPEPPQGRGDVRDKWENQEALVNLARTLQPKSLTELVENLQRRASLGAEPKSDAVTVCSLHAAKGLEWDSVFLVGVSEGLIPISYATTAAMVEEERRLLYVGITRAQRWLQISYAKSRSGGRSRSRERSRFLERLWPSEADASAGQQSGWGRGRKQRPADADSFDADTEKLWESLKRWRTQAAKEMQVRAYYVFTDQVLANIAHARPATPVQLRQVSGVGEMKLAAFGQAVLAVIAQHESD
ncbi:MAG: ATP-dependent DNA helicase UvrD2 [Actinomycetaceae bacterium]|nr:ATP-dependent DNA helicase UvrD2 [Actinomycetaceae bacterium]